MGKLAKKSTSQYHTLPVKKLFDDPNELIIYPTIYLDKLLKSPDSVPLLHASHESWGAIEDEERCIFIEDKELPFIECDEEVAPSSKENRKKYPRGRKIYQCPYCFIKSTPGQKNNINVHMNGRPKSGETIGKANPACPVRRAEEPPNNEGLWEKALKKPILFAYGDKKRKERIITISKKAK